MITKYYKCTLDSDIILNKSMATTDNISTLEYIPGSVFLGVVAQKIYGETGGQDYEIFHSGAVKFGDAIISDGNKLSYHFPFSLYRDKLNEDSDKYLHHLLNDENFPKNNEGNKIQIVQIRNGYFNLDEKDIKVNKQFSEKSKRNPETRRSEDEQMFGYESVSSNQTFIFPITFESKDLVQIVEKALIGNKRIGKSKTAEYSLAKIEKVNEDLNHSYAESEVFALVYAHSNLCFLDENGQPNLQPDARELGLENGKIDWEKSQVRVVEYTSWNGKRKTHNAQRYCIAMGSVFYIKVNDKVEGREDFVGEYQSEGLGHILINPAFLFNVKEKTENQWGITISNDETNEVAQKKKIATKLGMLLKEKADAKKAEFKLSKQVINSFDKNKNNFKEITSSQWGVIRNYAIQANDLQALIYNLFDRDKGCLTNGVAYDRYWSKSGNIEKLNEVIKGKSPQFTAEFAAEMAKETKNKK